MAPILSGIAIGVGAGLVAGLAMDLYQRATASLFGQDDSDDDPATVKAADSAKAAVGAPPVTRNRRAEAGSLIHYLTAAALGVVYVVLVAHWPPAAIGFGIVFGLGVSLVLDDFAVPAFGWGPWPWATPLATHAYSLTAHVVFGAALEGVRRLGAALLL